MSSATSAPASIGSSEPIRRRRSRTSTAWPVAACAVLVGAVTIVPVSGRPTGSPALHWATLGLAAALLTLAAVVCARSTDTSSGFLAPLSAALASALAVGWLAAPTDWYRAHELGVFLGLVACATTTFAIHVVAADGTYSRMLRSVATWFACAAAGLAAIILVGWPVTAYAAVIAASTPVLMRALPALDVGVTTEELLDHSVLMRLRWAVRSPIPDPPAPIGNERVRSLVRAGRIQRTAGLVLLCSALVPAMAVVATQAATTTVERIATAVLGGSVVLFLALAPRDSRGKVDRWVPRVTAVVVAAEVLLLWLPRVLAGGLAMGGVAILLSVGVVLAVSAIPAGGGARSLGLSRTGDTLEALTIFLVVPAGFVAGGFIDLVRGLVG